MRKYRVNATSTLRVDYGVELVAGLRRFKETAGYADAFETLNDALFAQFLARLKARKPMVTARVPVRAANYDVDQALRACASAAKAVDGCAGGPLFKSIFKDGLGRAVRPDGAAQIAATETVITDLGTSAALGIDDFRTEWLPKLQGPLDALKKAAEVLEARRKDYLAEFKVEIGLRNQHWTAVEVLQGQVRAAFPGNTAKQDLVFPEVEEDDEEAAATKQATPAAPAAPIGASPGASSPAEAGTG